MLVLSILALCELSDQFTTINNVTIYFESNTETASIIVNKSWRPIKNINITCVNDIILMHEGIEPESKIAERNGGQVEMQKKDSNKKY